MLHNATITLFNRVKGTRSTPDTWERRVLHGVKVETKYAMSAGTQGDTPAHYTLLLIPAASVAGTTYVSPEMYQAASDRANLLAFQPDDYFCVGEQEWQAYDELCKVAECHRITSAAFFGLLPHYEVTAS